MEIMGFNTNELKTLEELLQVSNNVGNELEKLYTLEINGLKESNIYKQALLELTRAINIENETYQQANLSHNDCYKFTKLLSSQTNLPLFDIKPTTSINNYKNKTFKRVINILIQLMLNNHDFHKNILPANIIQQAINLHIINKQEDLINSIINSVRIQTAIDTDINSMFLSILEDEIHKKTNENYRNELIKAKYCLATTNKELEIFLIETKFNIPTNIYINSKIVTQLLQAGENTYNFIRLSELKSKAKIEISKLLNIKDSEYDNPNTKLNSIIINCYLRALLSLMTNEELNDFNQEFHNQIDNPEYIKNHLNDRISENIIISCFKCFKYDKTKTLILSTN